MEPHVTAAALQLPAHDRANFTAAWPSVLQRVEDAAIAGAQLIVLPEGTIPAYVLGTETLDARQIDGAVGELRQLARRYEAVIVCGSARASDGVTYNSAIVVDADGTLAGHADKLFLWHFDRRWFAPGERIAVVTTAIGVLGVLICADGRMPGIASALADAGAQVLVMPTAWVTSGRNPRALENVQADLLARVRAWENGLPFVAANKCGVERGCVAYCGKSQIIDADGNVLASASQRDAETSIATIALRTTARRDKTRLAPPVAAQTPEFPRPTRVALTALRDGSELRAAMDLLESDAFVSASGADGFENGVAFARVDDAVVCDPSGLTAYRNAGYRLAIWDVGNCDSQWIEPLARARAVELRMFVAAVDASRGRAFATDPDGTIVAGTFDAYRVASFTLDPHRAEQTLVAPGTDVAVGLRRVADLASAEAAR